MRYVVTVFAACYLIFAIAACGGGTVLVESTPRPEPETQIEPISPPGGTFEIPNPDEEWTPATISSGLGATLVSALADRKSIALILPRGAAPLLEDRVFQMVKAGAPETKVVARGRATLDQLLEERGEIPYRVTMQPGGVDILGRPYYLPKEHPLNTDWLTRKKPLKGADGLLAVRPIRVDDTKLRRLREGRQGGCDSFEKALVAGAEQGVDLFRPYEEAASHELLSAFQRHLQVAMPYWQEEIDRVAGEIEPGGPAARCLKAYQTFVDTYKPCLSASCAPGPRFYLMDSGIVGFVDNGQLIPNNCPAQGMRDYAAELEDLAHRAVSEVLPALDNGWTGELVRSGGLAQLSSTIKETCAPRHRRIEPDDLTAARVEVKDFLTKLAEQDLSGEWEPTRGMERVPGVGPVKVLARVRVSGNNPIVGAAKLKTSLRQLDKCDEGRERLYQAALIDVGTSEVLFMGIFFEEELLCEGLPPGSP